MTLLETRSLIEPPKTNHDQILSHLFVDIKSVLTSKRNWFVKSFLVATVDRKQDSLRYFFFLSSFLFACFQVLFLQFPSCRLRLLRLRYALLLMKPGPVLRPGVLMVSLLGVRGGVCQTPLLLLLSLVLFPLLCGGTSFVVVWSVQRVWSVSKPAVESLLITETLLLF